MSENTQKPRIRFKGFSDAWEQRKLGELAGIVGGGTPSTGIPEFWDGDIDWYAPTEIADQIYLTSSQRKITEEGYNHSSAKMLPVGTVLFTSRAGIGKTAILTRKGCTNQGFQSIVPHKDKLDSYFIFSRTEELKQYGETVGVGSTFVEVSGKQMANMELMMPKTMEEQKTIGQYFKNLDHLITLHQRKYDKLVNLKKALLEKMFPADGETVPKIRFKGFSDAWEQRKFEDVAITRRGLTYSPSDISDKGIRVLRSSNINEDTFSLSDDDVFVCKNAVNIEYVKNNDILITSANGSTRLVGKHAIILGISENSTVHGGFMLVATAKNPLFLNASMSSSWYSKFISLFVSGGNGAIGNLSKSDLDSQIVLCPKDNEQQFIGGFFGNLDTLITLHQRQLEKLKKIKSALLEKMFV